MDKAKEDTPFVASAVPIDDEGTPPGDVHRPMSVTSDELRRFIGRPEAQQRIRSVVLARVPPQTPSPVINDIVQKANLAALASHSRPRSTATAMGWLATLTARTVANHFRHAAVERRWIAPDADAEEQPEDSGEPPADAWLIAQWLAPLLAAHPRDQETYELIVYKARTGETHAQVAAAHGMTTAALWNRIHAFKRTYEPRWRRRRERTLVVVLFFGFSGVAIVALVAWLLTRPSAPEIRPDPLRAAPRATPVPSVSASVVPFRPAQSATAPQSTGGKP
jgi:DNA-directed RNA polymerase specialized sigma24 family protein